jgi:hypothetical protein
MATVVAIPSTRVSDIPLIVTNAFTAVFWPTPVVYELNQMSGRSDPSLDFVQSALPPRRGVARAAVTDRARRGELADGDRHDHSGMAISSSVAFARTRKRIPFWL